MSDIDLEAIRKRAEAATPGPWIATNPQDDLSEWADHYEDPMVVTIDSTPGNYAAIAKDICQGPTDGVADAEFIAYARMHVPPVLRRLLERAPGARPAHWYVSETPVPVLEVVSS